MPLSLCAALLYSNFSTELQVAQQRSLDELARGYGSTILGRLKSADEALEGIVEDPSGTGSLAEARARRLSWVLRADASSVPALDPRQSAALANGRSVLIVGEEKSNGPRLSLVRQLPSGATLCVDVDPKWLWSDAGDFAGDTVLSLQEGRGRTLTSTGHIDTAPGDDWIVRSWELFLGGSFTTPSWTVVVAGKRPAVFGADRDAYLPIFAFILVTILLIAWLSMTSIRRQMRPLELLIGATRRLAQRDFGAFRDLNWNDEFGDLARSFGTMSGKLGRQFAALETFSDVDRLLLDEPELESILEKILPRIAAILSCERVAVLLFDADSGDSASVYEHCASSAGRLPMRRLSLAAAQTPLEWACFDPATSHEIRRIETLQLRHGEGCTGLLCLAYTDSADTNQERGVEATDFADRLSLIIASLKHSDQLRWQANFDSLTGLQNRQKLADCVAEAVAIAAQRDNIGSLLYIDLDHFKRVNDTSGHAAGDRLLQVVSERLRSSVDKDASIARLGGDEFAVLLPSIQSPESARQSARGIIALLTQPIVVDNRLHQISASIGITLFPADGGTLEELMRVGDIAMYHAKESGRGKAEFYHPDMQRTLLERVRLEDGLRRAFQDGELVVHYQPIVSLDDPVTFSVEALLRWPVEGGTAWISPTAFIPLAEENGLIVEIGHWVLRSTCEQFARWRASHIGVTCASVNVSVRQLKEPDYLDKLLCTLREHDMRGDELQIEITESVLGQETELKGVLGRIAALGVRLALDDFGTGYSSLGYLRTFPIDTVKIDRSFLMDVPHDAAANQLVESIILLCAALGKKVVAEGVETDEQRRYLTGAGCTTLQGYHFARPMHPAEIPAFAKRLQAWREVTLAGDDDRSSTPDRRTVSQR